MEIMLVGTLCLMVIAIIGGLGWIAYNYEKDYNRRWENYEERKRIFDEKYGEDNENI